MPQRKGRDPLTHRICCGHRVVLEGKERVDHPAGGGGESPTGLFSYRLRNVHTLDVRVGLEQRGKGSFVSKGNMTEGSSTIQGKR